MMNSSKNENGIHPNNFVFIVCSTLEIVRDHHSDTSGDNLSNTKIRKIVRILPSVISEA